MYTLFPYCQFVSFCELCITTEKGPYFTSELASKPEGKLPTEICIANLDLEKQEVPPFF